MRFRFNPLYSLLAIVLNMSLVWYFNTDVSLFPLNVPEVILPPEVIPSLGVQFVISAVMPGFVGPMAEAAGKDDDSSLALALVFGSVFPGILIAWVGTILHFFAGTPNLLSTIIGITALTVVPCAALVLFLRFVRSYRYHKGRA